jgi:hypothetical protein
MLEDLSNHVLTEIFSYLGQDDLHLGVALVCKRFFQVTKSPSLSKCVYYDNFSRDKANQHVTNCLEYETNEQNKCFIETRRK